MLKVKVTRTRSLHPAGIRVSAVVRRLDHSRTPGCATAVIWLAVGRVDGRTAGINTGCVCRMRLRTVRSKDLHANEYRVMIQTPHQPADGRKSTEWPTQWTATFDVVDGSIKFEELAQYPCIEEPEISWGTAKRAAVYHMKGFVRSDELMDRLVSGTSEVRLHVPEGLG